MADPIINEIKNLAEEIRQIIPLANPKELKKYARKLYELTIIYEYLSEDATREKENPLLGNNSFYEAELAEPATEKIKDIVAQMPEESEVVDSLLNAIITPKKNIDEMEVFAAEYATIPEFERKPAETKTTVPPTTENTHESESENKKNNPQGPKVKSVNEALNKNTAIGLNDRIAFTKHLFNGNAEDYTRVLSQIGTLNSASEVKDFVENIVKPDYDWEGKEFYVEKFISVFTKKFE